MYTYVDEWLHDFGTVVADELTRAQVLRLGEQERCGGGFTRMGCSCNRVHLFADDAVCPDDDMLEADIINWEMKEDLTNELRQAERFFMVLRRSCVGYESC